MTPRQIILMRQQKSQLPLPGGMLKDFAKSSTLAIPRWSSASSAFYANRCLMWTETFSRFSGTLIWSVHLAFPILGRHLFQKFQ